MGSLGDMTSGHNRLPWASSVSMHGQPHTLILPSTNGAACRQLCHEMIELHGIDRFRPVTGLPISTYFSAFKVKWLLENVPEVQTAVAEGDAMIGTVDSWLIYNLTGGAGRGVHVTDGVPAPLSASTGAYPYTWLHALGCTSAPLTCAIRFKLSLWAASQLH